MSLILMIVYIVPLVPWKIRPQRFALPGVYDADKIVLFMTWMDTLLYKTVNCNTNSKGAPYGPTNDRKIFREQSRMITMYFPPVLMINNL